MQKRDRVRLFGLIAALLVVTTSPAFAAGEEATAKRAADIQKGKRIFQTVCFACHGTTGEGDGGAAMFIGPYMHPRPNNFTLGVIKFRSTESGEMPTLSDLIRTIRNGIPGFMPSFRNLKGDGIRQVALYISSRFMEDPLSTGTTIKYVPDPYTTPGLPASVPVHRDAPGLSSGEQPAAEADPRTGGAEAVTVALPAADGMPNAEAEWTDSWFDQSRKAQKAMEEDKRHVPDLSAVPFAAPKTAVRAYAAKKGRIARGRTLFYEMQCVSCHGVGGRGAKTNMKDERGLPIRAADLSRPETLGNGHAPDDIYRTIMTGLNGTPMPSFSDLFIGREEEVWDLVYYVLSLQKREEVRTN